MKVFASMFPHQTGWRQTLSWRHVSLLVWLVSLRLMSWLDLKLLIPFRPAQWHQQVTCTGVCCGGLHSISVTDHLSSSAVKSAAFQTNNLRESRSRRKVFSSQPRSSLHRRFVKAQFSLNSETQSCRCEDVRVSSDWTWRTGSKLSLKKPEEHQTPSVCLWDQKISQLFRLLFVSVLKSLWETPGHVL